MDISIICTTFRSSALLVESLRSWRGSISSSHLDCEIIIALDDYHEIKDIPSSLRSTYSFIPVKNKPTGSHTEGFNRAVKISRGEVLLFTFPDILFSQNLVEQAATVKENEMLSFPVIGITQEEQEKVHSFAHAPNLMMTQTLLARTMEGTYFDTYALRRNTQARIGPFPRILSSGDAQLWLYNRLEELGVSSTCSRRAVGLEQWRERSDRVVG